MPETAAAGLSKSTTSGALLARAIATFGLEAVAQALRVSPRELEEFRTSGKKMSLMQQQTLGVAVASLSTGRPELRRRAIALLGQVRAAAEFQAGVTERHAGPPPSHRW